MGLCASLGKCLRNDSKAVLIQRPFYSEAIQKGRQTDRPTHRQTDRQTDRQTGRQTDSQTDRQSASSSVSQLAAQAASQLHIYHIHNIRYIQHMLHMRSTCFFINGFIILRASAAEPPAKDPSSRNTSPSTFKVRHLGVRPAQHWR